MSAALRGRQQGGCLSEEEASDFVAGALSPDGIRSVEAHLDACTSCLSYVAELARAVGALTPEVAAVRSAIARPSIGAAHGLREPVSRRARFPAADRFRIVRQLGAGGMGVVYEAFDREHGTRVALKMIPARAPDSLLRFKN